MLFWNQSLQDKFCIILYKYTYQKKNHHEQIDKLWIMKYIYKL